MAISEATHAESPGLSARTKKVILAMTLAAFMAVLNGTTVTASLEALSPILNTSISGVVWVTTIYLIAASASVPLFGWLTDRLGSNQVFRIALIGFAAGSLLCGFAWNLEAMLAFRFPQGLAGGMLEPAAIAVIGSSTPSARLGRVMGLVSLAINLGPVLGPLIGGSLVEADAWSWIFWVNVPFAVAVGVLAWRVLPAASEQSEVRSIDGVGLALLPPGFVFVLLGLNRWGAGSPTGLVTFFVVAGFVLLVAYIRHALRVQHPLLDIRLLRIRPFAAALGVFSIVGMVMYSQLSVLPLVGEHDLSLHGAWASVPVAVLGVGLMISMTLAGRASDVIGTRNLVSSGAGVTVVMAILFVALHRQTPTAVVLLILFGLGLGFGAVASPTFASVYRVLPSASIAQGTAALFIVVQLFASAGVTIVGFLGNTASDPEGMAYIVIALLSVLAMGAGRLLPGRPT